MTPRMKSVVLLVGIEALMAGCGPSSNISKEPEHGIVNGKMYSTLDSKPDSPGHTIVMPHDEPVFPPGPGHDEFVSACVVCHSPRYVTMQPRFSRTTWLSEVNKMKDVYGAHIIVLKAHTLAAAGGLSVLGIHVVSRVGGNGGA
jgi:mono/diheme cytochrome c family protein